MPMVTQKALIGFEIGPNKTDGLEIILECAAVKIRWLGKTAVFNTVNPKAALVYEWPCSFTVHVEVSLQVRAIRGTWLIQY